MSLLDKMKKQPDNTCSVEKCGKPMFESAGYFLCEDCDMITEAEIATRKS